MDINDLNKFVWPGKTILIAEDELINYRLLQVMLSKSKVQLLHALNGAEALLLFKRTPHIDLILMDLKMPEMDGIEVTREIRRINCQIPIIAQTAFALDEEKNKSLEAGCNAYITKPINKKELICLIDSFLSDHK